MVCIKKGEEESQKENTLQQEAMDSLPVGFCDALYTTNGFVTGIAAGHVVGIGKEEAQ